MVKKAPGKLRRFEKKLEKKLPPSFHLRDILAQFLGAALLIAPIIMTQEVWDLALRSTPIDLAFWYIVYFAIGAGLLHYIHKRELHLEPRYLGIPARLIALFLVSIVTPLFLTISLNVYLVTTDVAGLVIFLAKFAIVGAATADLVFRGLATKSGKP